MSDFTLPDDPAQWPEDPFALFGLSPDADKRALRKAYSQLIKRFKPEQKPDEFRKIRDAYEAVLSMLEFRESVGPWSSRRDDASEKTPGTAETSATPLPHVGPDKALAAWNLAREGDEAGGYEQLRALLADTPGDEDICLRLYWLLLLNPTLDGTREPLDWIDHALERGAWTRRMAGLLVQHARVNPQAAVSDRYTSYLKLATDSWQMLTLLNCRWRAASVLQSWSMVLDDLRAFKQRSIDLPHTWAQALVLAMDYIVWGNHPKAVECRQYVRQEIAQLKDVELAFAEEYDRLEFLQELSSEARRLRTVSSVWRPLADLLSRAQQLSFEEVRRELLFFLQDKVQTQPPTIMSYLARLAEVSETAVMGLSVIIKRFFANSSAMHQPDPDIKMLRRRFELSASGLNFSNYEMMRQEVFLCCTDEYVLPDAVTKALELNKITVDRGVTLADVIEGDEVLLLAVLACNGFWADPQPQVISEDMGEEA